MYDDTLYHLGDMLREKLLANYFAFERIFAGLGFVGVGVALSQTNASAGGASLLFVFIGYLTLIVILPLLAFMSGSNPLNRAVIKGLIFAALAVTDFAALTIGVLSYLIAAGFFAAAALLFFIEPHIAPLVGAQAKVGASVERTGLIQRESWKMNPITRDAQFQ